MYNLLYKIAQNTAGILPEAGDSVYTLASKVAQNTAGTPPAVGDSIYNLLYKIAGNTAGILPNFGDGKYDLLYKITANTEGGNIPRVGDGKYNLLYKIAGNTTEGGEGPTPPPVDSDVAAQQARIAADGGAVTDIDFLSGLIGDLKAAGCYALLDALYVPIACKKDGSNRVSKLYDLSPAKAGGVYYDAVQNTTASQQLWEASKIDGKPWVLFDPLRIGGYLSATVVPYIGYPFTHFIVVRAGSTDDNIKAIFGRASNVDRLDMLVFHSTNKVVSYVGASGLNTFTDISTTAQFTCFFNGASSTTRRKGVQIATGDTGTISPLSNLQFSLGDYRTFWPLNGSIAFVAACYRAVTTQQRDAIEGLLNTKYYPSTVA